MILVLINYNNPDTRQSAVFFFIHMNLILNYISIKLNDYYYTNLVQIWM